VDGGLEPVHRRAAHLVLELRRCQHRQAAFTGHVGIRLFQQCAARAQRAVDIELYPGQPEMVVIKPGRWRRSGNGDHVVYTASIRNDPDFELALVPCPAKALPVLHGGAHIGDRCDPVGQQYVLCLAKREIELHRFRSGNGVAEKIHGGIDENARRLPARLYDSTAARRFGGSRDPCGLHRRSIDPCGMAIDPAQVDRAIPDHHVQLCGGRKAAEPPRLLVPAATDDPLPVRVVRSIAGDPGERLSQRLRVRQIQRQRAETHIHDMAVRIEKSWNQRLALAVKLKIHIARPLVPTVEQLFDLAVVVNQHRGKADHLAIAIQRHAVNIFDQAVGMGRSGHQQNTRRTRA